MLKKAMAILEAAISDPDVVEQLSRYVEDVIASLDTSCNTILGISVPPPQDMTATLSAAFRNVDAARKLVYTVREQLQRNPTEIIFDMVDLPPESAPAIY